MSRRLRLLRQRVYRIIYPLAVPGSGGGASSGVSIFLEADFEDPNNEPWVLW